MKETANRVNVPMPLLSILIDRFLSAKAKGRQAYDWSAIGLNISEDAGINIQHAIEKNLKDIANNNTY